jgi:hypothetical protein
LIDEWLRDKRWIAFYELSDLEKEDLEISGGN